MTTMDAQAHHAAAAGAGPPHEGGIAARQPPSPSEQGQMPDAASPAWQQGFQKCIELLKGPGDERRWGHFGRETPKAHCR